VAPGPAWRGAMRKPMLSVTLVLGKGDRIQSPALKGIFSSGIQREVALHRWCGRSGWTRSIELTHERGVIVAAVPGAHEAPVDLHDEIRDRQGRVRRLRERLKPGQIFDHIVEAARG
jgi:hypothetical protein